MINYQSYYEQMPYGLQRIAFNLYTCSLHLQRYGKAFRQTLNELLKSQYFEKDRIDEYQDVKLKSIIRHAYGTVPYYRAIFDKNHIKPDDIRSKNDLYKIPILTKDDIRLHLNDMISAEYRINHLIHGHTSGTTGSPLDVYYDRYMCVFNNAVDWRHKISCGIDIGEPIAIFLGRVVVPIDKARPPYWQQDHLHNHLWMSSFHLNEKSMVHYFDKLVEYKPVALEGYPSTMFILAKYLQARKTTFPLKAVFTSSETLFDIQKETIEDAFRCPIFDYYGMAERVVFATECEKHGGHHLNFEYAVNEIVDGQHNVLSEDNAGILVGTSLQNYGMPLIRYKTNDMTDITSKKCDCGRESPLMSSVTTKSEDIVVTTDGRMISPSILTHPFKPLVHIKESQIIQEDCDRITIKIVRREEYTDNDTFLLLKEMKKRLGDGVDITIEFVDGIPRSKNGKYKWVISKVPLPIQ